MNINSTLIVLVFVANFVLTNMQETFLDERFLPLLRFGLQSSYALVRPKTFQIGFNRALKNKKVQRQFEDDFAFFCDVNGERSDDVPSSVHMLRPGDIDLVGAIGDSVTIGTGAFAVDPREFVLEGKGENILLLNLPHFHSISCKVWRGQLAAKELGGSS
jgi:hypothetical protein